MFDGESDLVELVVGDGNVNNSTAGVVSERGFKNAGTVMRFNERKESLFMLSKRPEMSS